MTHTKTPNVECHDGKRNGFLEAIKGERCDFSARIGIITHNSSHLENVGSLCLLSLLSLLCCLSVNAQAQGKN